MTEKRQFYMLVGQNIRRLRRAGSRNQEELANRIGLTRSSLAQIESGHQAISLFHAYLVADSFGVDMKDLVPQDGTTSVAFDKFSSGRIGAEDKEEVMEILDRLPTVGAETNGNTKDSR